jgi:hypothetical protein
MIVADKNFVKAYHRVRYPSGSFVRTGKPFVPEPFLTDCATIEYKKAAPIPLSLTSVKFTLMVKTSYSTSSGTRWKIID